MRSASTSTSRRLLAAAASVALVACSRDLSVPAKRPLTLAPAAAAIAPRERLTFVAEGGAGGYVFALGASPGSGSDATIGAATGAYRAGSTGPGADVVVVTDQAGATATATVAVTAALAVSPQVAIVAPGGKATFGADGGLAPYAFRFQRKGNRSGGHIDSVTGEYTAGPNPGTEDKVEVVDAAGAVAQPSSPISVGAIHLPLPGGAAELELADLNGDGRRDVVAIEPAAGPRRLTTTLRLPGGAVASETYYTSDGSLSAQDLTGDGRADLLAGTVNGAPATLFLPDASGHLAGAQTFAAASAPRLPYVLGTAGFTACPLYSGVGIYRLGWNAGTATFDPPACVTSASPRDVAHLRDLAYGRFEADVGAPGVVWLEDDVSRGIYGQGTPQLHFVTSTPHLLGTPGGGLSTVLPRGGARQQVVPGDFHGGGAADTAVLLAHASSRNLLYVVPSFTAGTAPAWASGSLDPFGGGPPALGIARCPPLPGTAQDTLVAWNGGLRAAPVTVDAGGIPALSPAHVSAVYVPITVAACGDVNGDGVPDLALASDSSATLALLWGDGDGGFGRRPHFAASDVFTMAQVDGDGVGDVVIATDQPSLVTLLGDEHQLARVAETPIAVAPAAIWAGDLGGAAVPGWAGDLVVADTSSNLYVAAGSPSGHFGRLAPVRDAPGASGRTARILRVAFADLGGAGAGKDVVVLYELAPPGSAGTTPADGSYELAVILRPASGSPRVISLGFATNGGADVQPVDLDGDGVDELVLAEGHVTGAGSVRTWSPVRLRVDPAAGALSAIGNAPWAPVNSTQLPLTAVGRWGDVAVFTARGSAVLVSGAGPDPAWAVTTLPGGLVAPTPAASRNVVAPGQAALGPASPLGAAPVLVLADAAGVHVLPGVLDGGRLAGFAAGPTGKAPGVVAGLAPQGAGAPDVLVFTGEDLLPLSWSGGALR